MTKGNGNGVSRQREGSTPHQLSLQEVFAQEQKGGQQVLMFLACLEEHSILLSHLLSARLLMENIEAGEEQRTLLSVLYSGSGRGRPENQNVCVPGPLGSLC